MVFEGFQPILRWGRIGHFEVVRADEDGSADEGPREMAQAESRKEVDSRSEFVCRVIEDSMRGKRFFTECVGKSPKKTSSEGRPNVENR